MASYKVFIKATYSSAYQHYINEITGKTYKFREYGFMQSIY